MTKRVLRRSTIVVILVLVLLALGWQTLNREAYRAVRAIGRSVPIWAQSGWVEASEGNFVLYYQAGDAAFAANLLSELNMRLEQLSIEWGFALPNQIPVRVHPSYESLNRAIGWEGESHTLGAYMLGRLELISPSVWHPGLSEIQAWKRYVQEGPIVHELAHMLLDYAADGNYPVWFSEGFAQYWEYRSTGYVWSEPGFALADNVFSLEKLHVSFYDCQPEIAAYRQSLAMVDSLYSEYGREGVAVLIDELAGGASFEQALLRSTGNTMDQFDVRWRITLND